MHTSMPWSNVEVKPNSGQQGHVWSGKSFASAIRGDQSNVDEKSRGPSLLSSLPMPKFSQKFGPPSDISAHRKHLQEQYKIQSDQISDIEDVLSQLENMFNEQTNTEDYRKTRDALKQKLDERATKRLQLQRDINELERVERVQELNNEINGDLDDIFSQIEIERQKGFQEYIERLSPDNSINGSEEEYHSNTTPEPSRTPTQFNVNASEFKPSPKRNNENVKKPNQPTVTYHQPGYIMFPVRTVSALSTVSNNLVQPHLYTLSKNQKY